MIDYRLMERDGVLTVKGFQEISKKALDVFLCPFCEMHTSVEFEGHVGYCSFCGQMIVVSCPGCSKHYKFVYGGLV